MQTYQDYLYFLDRYRHIVFNFIAEDLSCYVDYPKNKLEEKQILVDGRIKIKAGPYKEFTYHVFKYFNRDPTETTLRLGPDQYKNFLIFIRNNVDARFPNVIEKYASKDCDFKFCSVKVITQ